MPEDQKNQNLANPAANTDNNDSLLIDRLPDFVRQAMASEEAAEINGKIAEKYQLKEDDIPLMTHIIALTVLKETPLMDFPRALKDTLNLDVETTKAMAADIAIRQFLPLKNHLGDVETLIRKLGGEVPLYTKTPESKSSYISSSAKATNAPAPPHKSLRTALKDNKEIEEQLITSQPIKIQGFDGPVRPSLKNWLSDYIRLEGAGSHSLMVLTDYLYNSPNGKMLGPQEKKLVGKILQSYDENTPLPVSDKTGLLLLEYLDQETTAPLSQSSKTAPSLPPSAASATPRPQSRTAEPLRSNLARPSATELRNDSMEYRPTSPASPVLPQESSFQQSRYSQPARPQPTAPVPPFSPQPLSQSRPLPQREMPKETDAQPPLQAAPPTAPPSAPSQNINPPSRGNDWQAIENNRPPSAAKRQDGYLEPIDDLESNVAPSRPISRPVDSRNNPTRLRLDGNIIDLKNPQEP